MKPFDVVIIGGGIVGMATALQLTRSSHSRVLVVEAEPELGAHQTGHNSGVIHSGVYYKPGSLKARSCADGRDEMYAFCAEHGIAHERCGKVVVATSDEEIARLDELERRSRANGLPGIRRLSAAELKQHEPHVAGVAGLLVPTTGIVDYRDVVAKYGELFQAAGGELRLSCRLLGATRHSSEITLETSLGEFRGTHVISCCGLQSDRVARLCGFQTTMQIVPFRGEYYQLRPERQHLVRHLIYPVPDPRFPFLGVHFTRMVKGGVEAGPNAVLAFKREGYHKTDVSPRDLAQMLTFSGFWRMASTHWRTGVYEFQRSLSKAIFVKALQKLVPEIRDDDVEPRGAGVRAQAVDATGRLIDDFLVLNDDRSIHVLNAPSPAATASLSIGRTIADLARQTFSLS